nr:serine/threonine-protein phosphatase rdgC-like [Onthophagus taurus]
MPGAGAKRRKESVLSSLEMLSIRSPDLSPEETSDADHDDQTGGERKSNRVHINCPLTITDVDTLIETFKTRRHHRLHAKYVAQILKESIAKLRKLPNLNIATTSISKQITICGDLHGKLDDLLVILHKNGLPSQENPYIFNGDYVDRGKKGIEVLLLLLACFLAFPGAVYLNRGNHEDNAMNSRYGFTKEVQSKYRENAEVLLRLIDEVYRWLPLGTIINNKILVVHGGISNTTDLELIKGLNRSKYVSVLRPPVSDSSAPGANKIDKVEWKQVFDLLWSDPQSVKGSAPNKIRGAGCYFGPDVTQNFLKRYKLKLLIRSHECKADGYEVIHNEKVITIFSASNYYELGSNKGAYVKLVGSHMDTHYVQYTAATSKTKNLTITQRLGVIERSALRELRGHIISNRERLECEFKKYDVNQSGFITISEWCSAMLTATGLSLPWRILKDKLVLVNPDSERVQYGTTFDFLEEGDSYQTTPTVSDTLYRNKSNLEAIFRIIDKDDSGSISLEEMLDAYDLIKEHIPTPITKDQLKDICRMMDLNNDGMVDLNEFLEAFRIVDPEQKSEEPAVIQPKINSPLKTFAQIDKFMDETPNVSPSKTDTNGAITGGQQQTGEATSTPRNHSLRGVNRLKEVSKSNPNSLSTLTQSPVLSSRIVH